VQHLPRFRKVQFLVLIERHQVLFFEFRHIADALVHRV
jgi:hypothetical protein